ncbi:flagellar brake protein [Noviherbaspirillum galbum]|uniref:Flagellar brake protein YcgR n=1 Tax=Noviherbaspirillum galbum TaxID=2709383 RepID=A0A6B3SP80_9BURK|nr:flagellar brake protein [Noviherbaspirillum galbum]NEX62700.1 flagellar brake protein [Noviherbaspirillum galbum]
MSNTSDDLSQYRVYSRREIISLLRAMCERNQLVSMRADGGENVVTSVLEIDEASDLVVIDRAPGKLTNQRILDSENVTFETVLDSIRILFFATEMQECLYEERPALCAPLPKSVIRLQRREHFRVPTPVANPLKCIIPKQNDDGSVTSVLVMLKNISANGIGVIDEKKQLDNTIGAVYKDCKLEIPGGPPVIATLQIRNSLDQSLPSGKAVRRLGCMFVNLPNASMSNIQRFITKLERERNAKATGMI